jgi:hypothetical protein
MMPVCAAPAARGNANVCPARGDQAPIAPVVLWRVRAPSIA